MFNHIKNVLEKTLVYNPKKTGVFLIGSTRAMSGVPFDAKLSDTDLLITPSCTSLKDYSENLHQVIELSDILNGASFGSFDIFFLSERVASLHLSYLPVFVGIKSLNGQVSLIDNSAQQSLSTRSLSNVLFRRNLYVAEALRQSYKCREVMPVADTTKARQTVKEIVRALKIYICAITPVKELDAREESLLTIKDVRTLKEIIDASSPEVPIGNVLIDALEGKVVTDWPEWMVAQEQLSYWFADVEAELRATDQEEERFYGSVARVREMLLPGLRNIIFERDEAARSILIADFADNTASILIRLGLSGVSELLDFTTPATPQIVRQSYDILVDHLRQAKPDMDCLAASVILLEFALESSSILDVD